MQRKYAVTMLVICTILAFLLVPATVHDNGEFGTGYGGVDTPSVYSEKVEGATSTGEHVSAVDDGPQGPMKNPPVSNPKKPANSGLANSSDYSIKNDDDLGPGINTNNGAGTLHAELVTDEQQV